MISKPNSTAKGQNRYFKRRSNQDNKWIAGTKTRFSLNHQRKDKRIGEKHKHKEKMEANILPSSHLLHSLSFPVNARPSTIRIQLRLTTLHAAGPAANSGGDTNNNGETKTDTTPATPTQPRPPINTLNIRYRARSKRQARKQQQRIEEPAPKKDWESMTLAEKSLELYVGEKGLLFWLNKFAYASIFIIIGGWILFRFVGPSLGLYQLDTPPLSPTSILKGSS